MDNIMETINIKSNLIIEITDLKKSYGENHILEGFNMKLYEGENLVVMGKSGSGKSVMIKCLIGLEKPDSGSIMVMGKDINKLEEGSFSWNIQSIYKKGEIETFSNKLNGTFKITLSEKPVLPLAKSQKKFYVE
jgi:ABC-type dipeptide/oligopeptide/nickel transport system ATPase subunit